MGEFSIMELSNVFSQTGEVVWIGVRPERKKAMKNKNSVKAIESSGLDDDHYKSQGGKRQVTLIQVEHLMAVASFLGTAEIDPGLVRRNIVVKGINLLSLKNKTFKIGETVVMEGTGQCHPCSRMEAALGKGGYNAMRGHGGITAKILEGGMIKIGDQISFWDKGN